MICDRCSIEALEGIETCHACGGSFCQEHIVPEFHDCGGDDFIRREATSQRAGLLETIVKAADAVLEMAEDVGVIEPTGDGEAVNWALACADLDAALKPARIHPNRAINAEVLAEIQDSREADAAAGNKEGWHRGYPVPTPEEIAEIKRYAGREWSATGKDFGRDLSACLITATINWLRGTLGPQQQREP